MTSIGLIKESMNVHLGIWVLFSLWGFFQYSPVATGISTLHEERDREEERIRYTVKFVSLRYDMYVRSPQNFFMLHWNKLLDENSIAAGVTTPCVENILKINWTYDRVFVIEYNCDSNRWIAQGVSLYWNVAIWAN